MKTYAATLLIAGWASAQGFSAASQNGEQQMTKLMSTKIAQRESQRAAGIFGNGQYKSFAAAAPCIDGKSTPPVGNVTYLCNNVDLYSFLSHEDMGSADAEGSDNWGWTSGSGREFVLVGQSDGTAFVEVVTSTGELQYIGRLPTQTQTVIWRSIKVINGYAYIGSEAFGHGLQVFDLRKLEQVKERDQPLENPVTFSIDRDLTAWFSGFGASHNVVAHPETDMIYAVGGREGANSRNSSCAAGLYMVDVSDPAAPFSPGCVPNDGYVHDAQCVIYTGPDTQYTGREICFGYNEDSLTIYDLTDKAAPSVISVTHYEGNAYAHQGWLVDTTNQRYLVLDDELDEIDQVGVGDDPERTTTYIWDVAELGAPKNTGFYKSPVRSIDHNQFVLNGISYQSNYVSGLRIVDVSSVADDPTGAGFSELGFYDIHPEDDAEPGGGIIEFAGTWNNYPFFASGYVVVNTIERGLFSLRYNPAA